VPSPAVVPLQLSAGACCMALAACSQPLIDISCPQGAQQLTHCMPLMMSIDGTDGWTDGHSTVT